jgi:hypothetical protein
MDTSKSAQTATEKPPLNDPLYLPNPDAQLWERRFRSMYADARRRHDSVLRISEDLECALAGPLRALQKDWNSRFYILISVTGLYTLMVVASTLGLLFRSLSHFKIQIDAAVSNWRLWVQYPELVVGFLVCTFFAICLAIVPFRLAKRKSPLKEETEPLSFTLIRAIKRLGGTVRPWHTVSCPFC